MSSRATDLVQAHILLLLQDYHHFKTLHEAQRSRRYVRVRSLGNILSDCEKNKFYNFHHVNHLRSLQIYQRTFPEKKLPVIIFGI